MSVINDAQELLRRRRVIWQFARAELKAGHRDKVLGNLWQLIDPLAFMLVYYVVWSIILGRRGPEFMIYLLSGIVTFGMFQDSVVASSVVLRNQVRLIREVYFPKAALPAAVTISRLHNLVWALAAMLILEAVALHRQAHLTPEALARVTHPVSFGWNALWLPMVLLVLLLFTLGASFMSAIVGALFRDTPNVLNFVLRLWFYLSPLFYYPEEVRGRSELAWTLYRLNPFSHFFRLVRASLVYDKPPGLDGVLYVLALSVVGVIAGFMVFSRYEGVVVKQL